MASATDLTVDKGRPSAVQMVRKVLLLAGDALPVVRSLRLDCSKGVDEGSCSGFCLPSRDLGSTARTSASRGAAQGRLVARLLQKLSILLSVVRTEPHNFWARYQNVIGPPSY